MKAGVVTTLAIVAIVLTAPLAAEEANEATAFEQDIRKLLHLTMPDTLLKEMMTQMLQPIREVQTNVPDEFWQRFVDNVSAEELIDLTVPIYKRHFTHQDIKELTAFFESPTGQKFLAKQPTVMQESIAVGQLWGASLAKKVQAELKAEGLQ